MSLSVQSIGVRPYQSYGVSKQDNQPQQPSFQMLKPPTTTATTGPIWPRIVAFAVAAAMVIGAALTLSGGIGGK